ncbi:hypothetical protein AAG906_025905 [Vitis piasezkii]
MRSIPDYNEAMSNVDAHFWQKAMEVELESMHSNHVWELVEAPKGIKPIGYKWTAFLNGNLDESIFMMQPDGFVAKEQEHMESMVVFMILYVDDILLIGDDFSTQFQMKVLGEAQYILWIKKCLLPSHGIPLSRDQCPKILEEKSSCNWYYASIMGSLMYITIKQILKYLRRTRDYMLVFKLKSVKQSYITNSTMEVEYVVASKVAKEAIWHRKFLLEHRVALWPQPLILFCDNSGLVA